MNLRQMNLTMAFLSKLLVVAAVILFAPAHADLKVPFLAQKTYTPLIFFKLPPGASPHCKQLSTKWFGLYDTT